MTDSDPNRAQRLGDAIMRELADILATESRDPRLELVTILGVTLDPTMNIATVQYTAHSDPEQVAEGLAHSRGYLRTELGRRLTKRRIPELAFQFDASAGTPSEETDAFEEMLNAARRR